MPRLERLLRPVNWKYAIGEIALIVAGILIAFAIDNWSGRRAERQREADSLREVRNALRSDLEDIKSNVAFNERGQRSTTVVLDHLLHERPYADSLDQHFAGVVYGSFLVANSSAYETLKQRGLELISDDSIRVGLAELYDVRYEAIQGHEDTFRDYRAMALEPYYRTRFRDFTLAAATPRSYPSLLADPEYEGLAEWTLAARALVLNAYRGVPERVERLIRRIDVEIGLLE